MNYFKGEKEFFPGIGKIEFEGRESKNPMAFHYYDENKVDRMKNSERPPRFAMAYWHTLCAEGADPVRWRNEDISLECGRRPYFPCQV